VNAVLTKDDRKTADQAAAEVDWAKLSALTEAEIAAAAADDLDNPVMTDEEKAKAYRPAPLAAAE